MYNYDSINVSNTSAVRGIILDALVQSGANFSDVQYWEYWMEILNFLLLSA